LRLRARMLRARMGRKSRSTRAVFQLLESLHISRAIEKRGAGNRGPSKRNSAV
jgi:hypothetical protein